MNNVVAMILAGGRGRRMDMLCHDRAKPLLSFAGRFNVIDFVLTNCVRSGINDIGALLDYQHLNVGNYIKQWQLINGRGYSFHILKPKMGSYKGTADAVYQNIDYVTKQKATDVLILAADHVYKIDYRKMLAFHKKVGADFTVGVVSVPIEQTSRFGTVKVNNDSRIIDFLEKPKISRSNLVSMGIYIFNKKTLIDCLVEDAADEDSTHDFGHAIIPKAIDRKRVFAYKFGGYWRDIGTIEAYYNTNMDLLRQYPAFSLNTTWSILTRDFSHLPPPSINREASVKNSLLSPECTIKGIVQNSVLSPGVKVEENAVVRDSVILSNTTIGSHSIVNRCILDEDITIGDYCYIGFTTTLFPGDLDITMLGKGITVPSGTAIGRNCKILPGVEKVDFLKKAIASNTILLHR